MKVFSSIRRVLMLAFCLSLSLPVLAISLYGHFFTGSALSAKVLEDSQAEAELQAAHLDYAIESLSTDARYLGMLPSVKNWQTQQDDELLRTSLEGDMLIFVAASPQIYRLHWLNSEGHPLVSIGSDSRSVYPLQAIERRLLDDGGYFAETTQSLASSITVSFGRSDDTAVMLYSLRFDDSALVLEVYASWVLRHLNETRQLWAVVNSEGEHLLFPEAVSFESAIPATNTALAPYWTRFEGNSGAFLLENSLFAYSRIEAYSGEHWLLYQQRPSAEIFAAQSKFALSSSAIILAGIVLSLGLGAGLATYLIRPLLRLRAEVENFADGISPHDVAHHALKELNALQQSFHRMAIALDQESKEKRKLISKLIDAQEEERKRIAYDLHDGLLQQLVGARFYLAMAVDNSQNGIKADLERGSLALSEAIVEGRRILQGLHPTILDDLGLEDALAELAEQQAERYTWELSLNIQRLPRRPDKTTAVTVFRIAQEAFNNIGKHAQANRVVFELANGDGLHLKISDDGQGFDIDSIAGQGFGVKTMHERAELLGGNCHLESTLNQGTKVQIFLPYQC